jgi:hypothetical protein
MIHRFYLKAVKQIKQRKQIMFRESCLVPKKEGAIGNPDESQGDDMGGAYSMRGEREECIYEYDFGRNTRGLMITRKT